MGFFASILMDFSKDYDCLKDDIFLAKFLSKRLFFKLSKQSHTKN